MAITHKSPPGTSPMLKNTATAPFVYFDNAPVFGIFSGNIEVELATRLLMPKPDGSVAIDMSCVAHLRCSTAAALVLIDALTKALDMVSKQQAERGDPAQYDGTLLAN
jgi:hypothetical protein